LQHCPDRSFVQDSTPHGLGLVGTGKIRHPHSHENQKQRDKEDNETNAAAMFFKLTHGGNVSDSLIQYKLVEYWTVFEAWISVLLQ